MNEEDIMKKIKEETDNIPVPESLSPENMEKMLNEHLAGNGNENAENTKINKTSLSAGKKFGLAIAACFGIIIIGSGALGIINRNKNYEATQNADAIMDSTSGDEEADVAEEEYADGSVDFDSMDEAADDADSMKDSANSTNNNSDENAEIEKGLVASGTLNNPSSYEDYYDAIYASQQENIEKYQLDEARNAGLDGGTTGPLVNDATAAYEAEGAADEDAASYESSAASDTAATYEASDSADNSASYKSSDTNRFNSSATDSAKTTNEKEFSKTNTQEKTVDEGDIVKTDGEYIYTANLHGYNWYSYDSQPPVITITKANNGKLNKVSTIELSPQKNSEDTEYGFEEFYIHKNFLVVMYQKSTLNKEDMYKSKKSFNNYDYLYPHYIQQTCIDIYDISNKAKPVKYKTLYQSGSYNSSRISDGFLYTISYFVPENIAFIDKKDGRTDYQKYIPYINDDTIAYGDIYYGRHLDSMGTYVITSVSLKAPGNFVDSKAVSCAQGEIYVSENAIYTYSTIYDRIQKTEIMKVAYNKGKLYIGNRAVIAGYLYGSFALSEYDKHLRIVSTIPANDFSWYDTNVWKDSARNDVGQRITEDINAVYVLDDNMKLTGRITGIAPGEQIYSARFFGNIGYFVTYRNTDPLFSIDFSDPKEPKILGQLKIPGFSNYLHFYGNGTLLGIGEETDPYTQNFIGLKLSMFDISDPTNVTEEDKYIIKDSYYSSAQYNHKSIMIDPEKNVFGFCYEDDYYDGDDNYGYSYYYSTYTYDKEKGFVETARYIIDYDYMYNIDDVRGLYIDDYFYLVTPQSIESYRLGDDKQIDRIYLE